MGGPLFVFCPSRCPKWPWLGPPMPSFSLHVFCPSRFPTWTWLGAPMTLLYPFSSLHCFCPTRFPKWTWLGASMPFLLDLIALSNAKVCFVRSANAQSETEPYKTHISRRGVTQSFSQRDVTQSFSRRGVTRSFSQRGLTQSFSGRGVAQTWYSKDLQRFKVEFKVEPFMIPRDSDHQ